VTDLVIVGMPLGAWQTNVYVVGDRERGECVVVDPGQTGEERVPELVERLGMTPTAILLSHAHIDHLWAAPTLAERYDVEVFLHPDDRWLWHDPQNAGGEFPRSVLVEQYGLDWCPDDERLVDLADGDRVTRAGVSFDVAHTPGHTPGHCTFLGRDLGDATVEVTFGDPETVRDVLFSGDLLFRGNIGRMDLRGGDPAAMLRSLAGAVLPMQDDTLVLCGHGPETTIARERATNPYLVEAARGAR
jgi:hydroxyacylglutathione hydrolase